MIEAKIILLLDLALSLSRGNIYDNYIINGWGQKCIKGEKDSIFNSNW